jgi:hypothetical protein
MPKKKSNFLKDILIASMAAYAVGKISDAQQQKEEREHNERAELNNKLDVLSERLGIGDDDDTSWIDIQNEDEG